MERLDELAAFAGPRVATIQPGHGAASGLDLIAQTRTYPNDFDLAVQNGDTRAVEQQILAKYPEYHVKQFLTMFSSPAFESRPGFGNLAAAIGREPVMRISTSLLAVCCRVCSLQLHG